MKFEFSDNINGLKPSIIREILKQMSTPGLISFAGGNPSPSSFPVDEINKISADLLKNEAVNVLQYNVTEGYAPLRKAAEVFFNRNEIVKKENDDLIIMSGSMQIVDFTAKCLCNKGDTVICEDPSFLGALNAIKAYGVELMGVPVESDGINTEILEQSLKAEKKPKFMYLIPNFQNPTGVTMSAQKRKRVYELAKKYGVPILEDNPYGDLRFDGETLPSIKSLDEEGLVIYAASFSKIMCPGMRIAAAIADRQLISKLVICKQGSDVHSTMWSQRICERLLTTMDMDVHLKKLQAVYGSKAKLMLSEIEKNFPDDVTYLKPQGGMFIWVTLPKRIDMQMLVKKALENKVAVVPGNAFYVDTEKPCQSIRMNFSTPSEEDIVKGVKILSEIMKSF